MLELVLKKKGYSIRYTPSFAIDDSIIESLKYRLRKKVLLLGNKFEKWSYNCYELDN